MNSRFTWLALVGAALFSIAVGMAAYNAGVAHGLASGAAAGSPAPAGVPYGWYRPWGFFPFAPFLFLFFWLFVFRVFAWRGYRGPWCDGAGPVDGQSRLDDWHRRAHERMNLAPEPPSQNPM